jgi:hypothetical protein
VKNNIGQVIGKYSFYDLPKGKQGVQIWLWEKCKSFNIWLFHGIPTNTFYLMCFMKYIISDFFFSLNVFCGLQLLITCKGPFSMPHISFKLISININYDISIYPLIFSWIYIGACVVLIY